MEISSDGANTYIWDARMKAQALMRILAEQTDKPLSKTRLFVTRSGGFSLLAAL